MKVALIGYGKMGRAVESVIDEYNQKGAGEQVEVALKIDLENLDSFTPDSLKGIDLAIEFTSPDSAVANIKKCLDAGVAVVCGSTGWYSQLDDVRSYCLERNGSLLFTPNFSVGVNILFELNEKLAGIMASRPGYKLTITESHHTEKLDAPSGTAITLAEQVMKFNTHYTSWEKGKADTEDTIGVVSFRESGVPGTHVINYVSYEDEITVIHKAHNRRGFATGAFNAALWLQGKKGVFTMKDVLSLND
jgi:4-hydroxy-tetrahydrodipicolinate reductase